MLRYLEFRANRDLLIVIMKRDCANERRTERRRARVDAKEGSKEESEQGVKMAPLESDRATAATDSFSPSVPRHRRAIIREQCRSALLELINPKGEREREKGNGGIKSGRGRGREGGKERAKLQNHATPLCAMYAGRSIQFRGGGRGNTWRRGGGLNLNIVRSLLLRKWEGQSQSVTGGHSSRSFKCNTISRSKIAV